MNTYDIGSLVTLTATFRNQSGALTNPTNVTFTVEDPTGKQTNPSPTNASTGVYTASVDLTGAAHGVWSWRVAGTGAVQAAEESQFFVEPSLL